MSAARRTHFRIPLTPANEGVRFQPTGFPDLGAALFRRPVGETEWEECLHVESPQSMANRFEDTLWDGVRNAPITPLDSVPYVQVVDENGEFLTASRIEPHRLASAYIMDGVVGDTGRTGLEWLPGELGIEPGKPFDHRRFARAVYRLDPVSLIHGVFFAQSGKGGWSRQPKVARAVTAFIDATDVMPAVSGGVKTDIVDTSGGHADTGYGMVPHHRIEYTARRITAHITVDHEQIASYGLEAQETELLEAIVDLELASFFGAGTMRLRTACELVVDEDRLAASGLAALPTVEEAEKRMAAAVEAAGPTLGKTTTVQRGADKGARSKSARAAKG